MLLTYLVRAFILLAFVPRGPLDPALRDVVSMEMPPMPLRWNICCKAACVILAMQMRCAWRFMRFFGPRAFTCPEALLSDACAGACRCTIGCLAQGSLYVALAFVRRAELLCEFGANDFGFRWRRVNVRFVELFP